MGCGEWQGGAGMLDEGASGSQEQSYSILDLGLLLKVSFEEKVTEHPARSPSTSLCGSMVQAA